MGALRLVLVCAVLACVFATESRAGQVAKNPAVVCSAGVVFLNPHNSSTYVLRVPYACDSSPLPRIEKLVKTVQDPFVSFFLKPPRIKRRAPGETRGGVDVYEGSGDFGHVGGDDEDDEDDEEEDEDDEEYSELGHLEPSNHVIPNLPTPTLQYEQVSNTYGRVEASPEHISPTPVVSGPSLRVQHVSSMVEGRLSTTEEAELDRLVFSNGIGSGDGGFVITTPLFNPSTTEESYYSSSTGSSRTSSPTSYATPELPFFHLLHPIPKQLIYSGVAHNYSIPSNTFEPPCSSFDVVPVESWVEVVGGSSVRFFPLTEHISDYKLSVVCRANRNARAELFVSVRQRQKSRLHNHEFVVKFGMIRGNGSRIEILERVVREIRKGVGGSGSRGSGSTASGFGSSASGFGSSGSSSDVVVVSTELDSYPFRVTYVNESIISNTCPVDEIKRISSLLREMQDGIKVESVTVEVPRENNQCDPKLIGGVTGSGTGAVSYGENFPPSIKNQIDKLNGSVGAYLVYHVKEDFCYDPEDGGTRGLSLMLKSNELNLLGERDWLQFDPKNQEFFGLPMREEKREFVLVCSDGGGKSANDVLELEIAPPLIPASSFNTEFNLHFQSIPFTPKAIRKFMDKLSQILSPDIQVHDFAESNGHVLFKWFNTSNPSTEHHVTEIRKVLLSDDGPVNKRLLEHFGPEFNVTVASVIPLRGLMSENNPVESDGDAGGEKRYFDFDETAGADGVAGGGGPVHGDGGIDNMAIDSFYSGYLTTYIIPSVLIAIMILLALIIACLLSRKNKYTQAATDEDSPNSHAYIKNAKKGVPVIFQDELDEKLMFGHGGARGAAQAQQQNIYERNTSSTPTSQTGMAPPPPRASLPRGGSSGGGFAGTPPSTGGHHAPPRYTTTTPSSTPQPPDYQNSISRSMRNRSMPPPGGVGVLPHGVHPFTNQIDSYAPPPGINYYGIHTSNSSGSGAGFPSGGMVGGPSVGSAGISSTPHHHHHHHHNQGKMVPPPYVPP